MRKDPCRFAISTAEFSLKASSLHAIELIKVDESKIVGFCFSWSLS